MRMQRLVLLSVLLVLVSLIAGCGERTLAKNQTYPVRGRVLLKGQPASYVMVFFQPVGKEGADAVGRTDNEGNFELRTYSNEGNDGAVPGEYKVTIEDYDPVQGGALPGGAKGVKVPGGQVDAGTQTIHAEENTLNIEIP
jgi:hypothetical protein